MGQQQLLLVILVTIIVGIATVVAINTFGSAADAANVDAVVIDISQIAAASQGFYMKPAMLGGGSRTFDGISFHEFAFPAAGIDADGLVAQNENGVYTIIEPTGTNPQTFVLNACPASSEGYEPSVVDNDGLITAPGSCDTPLVYTILPNRYQEGLVTQ